MRLYSPGGTEDDKERGMFIPWSAGDPVQSARMDVETEEQQDEPLVAPPSVESENQEWYASKMAPQEIEAEEEEEEEEPQGPCQVWGNVQYKRLVI